MQSNKCYFQSNVGGMPWHGWRVDPGVVHRLRDVGSWLLAAAEGKGALGRFGLPGQRSPAESGGVWGRGSGAKDRWLGVVGGWGRSGVVLVKKSWKESGIPKIKILTSEFPDPFYGMPDSFRLFSTSSVWRRSEYE